MFHQLLAEQLSKLSLSPEQAPDEEVWQQFLTVVSQAYNQHSAEQDRLQALLDNLADAIITFDQNGRIEWFNRAAEQMFGYTAVDIQGKHLEILLPDPHRVQVEQDTLALSTDKHDGRADILSIRNEISGQRHNGDTFPLSFTISQMMVQGERQFIGIARDITERKQAEIELLAAKEEAEQASQSKSRFLANTSHEIRTPLNAIIGLMSLLLDTPLSPAQQTYVETAQQSSNTLLAILNDILDLSKIEAGKLEFASRPFHLQSSILEVTNLLSTTASEKGLRLITQFDQTMPQVFEGDENRLRQILMNLISNAIKFTDRGEIQVRLTGQEMADDCYEVQIAIQDTGVGLPPNYQAWLFTAFEQGNSRHSQEFSGTGLGLAITQRLVKLMHGRIWVETEENQGTTFTITLPLQQSDAPITENLLDRVKPFDPDMAASHPLRILIAEDNVTNQKVMLWMLEHLGYEADVAANGRDVLQAHIKQPYDLILMDMQMPEMDGLAATRAIRQANNTPDKPWIIAVTADMQRFNQKKVTDYGFNDYLSKPIQAESLITALCYCPSLLAAATTPAGNIIQAAPEKWPIDRPLLAKIVDHDEQRLAELIVIYEQESQRLLDRLDTAVSEANLELIRQTAHALKGSCATLALVALTDKYRMIESMARDANPITQIEKNVAEARAEYDLTLTELKSTVL